MVWNVEEHRYGKSMSQPCSWGRFHFRLMGRGYSVCVCVQLALSWCQNHYKVPPRAVAVGWCIGEGLLGEWGAYVLSPLSSFLPVMWLFLSYAVFFQAKSKKREKWNSTLPHRWTSAKTSASWQSSQNCRWVSCYSLHFSFCCRAGTRAFLQTLSLRIRCLILADSLASSLKKKMCLNALIRALKTWAVQ